MVFLILATFKMGGTMLLKPMAHAIILNLGIQVVYLYHPKLSNFVNKFYLIILVSYNITVQPITE